MTGPFKPKKLKKKKVKKNQAGMGLKRRKPKKNKSKKVGTQSIRKSTY